MLVRVEPAHVSKERLGLRRTQPRINFKKSAGQNNHFLITVLVGLDAVREGKAQLNSEFATAWSPTNVARSAERSRAYAINTSLVWITDLTDVYRKSAMRIPGAFSAEQIRKNDSLDGMSEKLQNMAKLLAYETAPETLLNRLGIYWRNRVVHSSGNGRLKAHIKASLRTSAPHFVDEYRGLDINETIDRAESGEAPRFKEIASIIQASQLLVRELDARVLSRVNLEVYAESVIKEHISVQMEQQAPNVLSKLWPGSQEKSAARVMQILKQRGMSEVEGSLRYLDESYLSGLSKLTVPEAKRRFLA